MMPHFVRLGMSASRHLGVLRKDAVPYKRFVVLRKDAVPYRRFGLLRQNAVPYNEIVFLYRLYGRVSKRDALKHLFLIPLSL